MNTATELLKELRESLEDYGNLVESFIETHEPSGLGRKRLERTVTDINRNCRQIDEFLAHLGEE